MCPNLEDSVYNPGSLKIHHVCSINAYQIEFYKNSNYKKAAEQLPSVTYDDFVSQQSDISMLESLLQAESQVSENELVEEEFLQ